MSGASPSATKIMRNFSVVLFALAVWYSASACSTAATQPDGSEIVEDEPGSDNNNGDNGDNTADNNDGDDGGDSGESSGDNQSEESMTINITVGSKTFRADIDDTETGRAFVARLPLTLDMSELNGNEKYCYGIALPSADRHFSKIEAGDLMLYSGNCVVLFYGPAGGYSYTRIGRLHSVDGLAAALGSGSVAVTFGEE